MRLYQAAILAPIPLVGRYLFFSLAPVPIDALRDRFARLAGIVDGAQVLVGFGPQILQVLESEVPGLHQMQSITGHGIEVPCTPSAVCCWLRGSDRGDLIYLSHQLEKALAPVLRLDHAIDAFRHGTDRDLTGYENGTENPVDDAAKAAALVHNAGAGLDGSSFMAVQQWTHDFDAFEAMSTTQQDNSIGRRRSDNKELEEAPSSAHVKRTTQKDFDPPAFVLRRSMPWAQDNRAGLMFVAFGKSFDAFEAQLRRMAGVDDSVTDALFRFSKPVTGAFFWCPPMKSGRLDLRWLSF